MPALVRKDSCSPKTGFAIIQFIEFIPASYNPNPHSVVFNFVDNSLSTHCQRSGPVNGTVTIPCDNSNLTALWDGSLLTLTETYSLCNS
jgi:hypothetical protein